MVEISDQDYPLLSRIYTPVDLRRLSIEQLPALCEELRRFIISQLSTNPGHFASSMGAIELTVALHYVFDTPDDRIVWDVGHQAYGHKILTGRARCFDTNRRFGGLSGFPNPAESEYDTFTAGHASNSISAALGMSIASSLMHEDPQRHVVAVIGDASISGGLAFEGLNNASNSGSNLLIVLNDNDMSIDRNVGSLNTYLTRLNTNRTYNKLRFRLYNLLRRFNLVNEKTRRSILRFNNSLKALLAREQNIFEGLNIRYFGPFDGHDVEQLVRIFSDIRDMKGPKIVHLRTFKGKGFAPAEQDPATWHAPGKFDPVTGERAASGCASAPNKYQHIFGQMLLELARKDEGIVGITAAMPSGTSVNVMQAELPDRTFDVGISEGHAVTFAGGLAKEGLKPFVAIYSSFLQRGYDHIIHDVALQRLPVTFCIDRAGLVGEDGATHHGLFDIAYMRSIPGMIVSAPRDGLMLRRLMLTAASRREAPMAIRYPRGTASNVDAPAEVKPVQIGRAELLTPSFGKPDVVVLALGPLALRAADVAARLAAENIRVAVYDMIFVNPIDEDVLRSVAASGAPILTIEDGVVAGGMGSAVIEFFNREGLAVKPVTMLGVDDEFIAQGTVAELHKLVGLDADSIEKRIRALAASPNSNS